MDPICDICRPGGLVTLKSAGSLNPGQDGTSIHDAVQQQVGLKLEKRKEPVDVIVIDHIEKVPTKD
jgi:uncharacterized protein (TIGR03435 family)